MRVCTSSAQGGMQQGAMCTSVDKVWREAPVRLPREVVEQGPLVLGILKVLDLQACVVQPHVVKPAGAAVLASSPSTGLPPFDTCAAKWVETFGL